MSSRKFSELEIDAIGEIENISLGSSATALSTLLSTRVDITTPVVSVVSRDEFAFNDLEPAIGVEITYVQGLRGSNIMLLKRSDVRMIVEMMMGIEIPEEEFEMNEINLSAVCEVMNQMMGASSTALSEFLGETVNISTPTSFEIVDEQMFKEKYFTETDPMVCVEFVLRIGDNLQSKFMNLLPGDLAKKLVSGFFPDVEEEVEEPAPAFDTVVPEPAAQDDANRMMSQEEIEALLAGGAGTPEPEPEPEDKSGRVMSQEEIEALLAGGAGTPEPEPEPAAEDKSGRVMSQEEIEALLAGGAGTPEPEPEPAAEDKSGRVMSQEEIEALLAGGAAQEAAPAPAAQLQPQAAQPQPQAAQPQAVQPQVAQQPQAAQPQAAMQQPMMQQAPVSNALTEKMMGQMTQMTQMMGQMQQVMMEQMQQMQQMQQKSASAAAPKKLNVHPLPSDPLAGGTSGEEQEENIDMILGVPLEVSVEIGRTRKLVKDILEFTKGSLVVLDKVAGEQVDLFVNGQCVARGDVVVVEDNFGIRITEILADNMPAVE